MQTRIIHTKIYDDEWFASLKIEQKLLFIYLFTNQRIGLSGIYYLPDRIIKFETGLSDEQLNTAKKVFENSKKVFFYQGWVYVINASDYGGYKGGKNEIALNKELEKIPDEVKKYFNNRVSIGYQYPIDTSINHKSEIINQKSKNIGDESYREKGKKIEKNGDDEKSGLDLADGNGLTSHISSILKERIEKTKTNGDKKSGISTSWQDKAFRYAKGLKIDLNEEYKARWLKVFKLAYEGRNSKNVELAYSYLSDYPRELSNEAKIKLFFWIYEHGLPKQKLGFVGIKVLLILALFTFLFSFVFFLFYKIDNFFDRFSFEFRPPIVVKIQKPVEIVERKEKIVYIKEFSDSLPKPKTAIEKYICEKFANDCQIALAVAKAESGIREEAININSNGTIDMGIFQINSVHWKKPGCNPKSLLDGYKNIDCAYKIWQAQGWSPWVAYKNGRWLTVLGSSK